MRDHLRSGSGHRQGRRGAPLEPSRRHVGGRRLEANTRTAWGRAAMKPTIDDRKRLRAEAEARLARSPAAGPSHQDASRLLHELQVYRVELDIQNEELRRAQVALEEAHARQVDLYDFAPVGYLTLDANGLVVEANLTAAGMLNVDRRSLVGKRFGVFLGGDSATWGRFL